MPPLQCDLGRPACDRCKRAEVRCEGYERYPVFINRDSTGCLQKRLPLEEVKPQTTSRESESRFECIDAPTLDVEVRGLKSTVFHFQSRSIEAARFTTYLWQTFVRIPPSAYALQSPPHLLHYVIELPDAQPSLREALLAVSVANYGKRQGDPQALRAARRLYTRSLGLLQQALRDPQLARHDDTLVTIGLMVLYELFDPTTDDAMAWLQHIAGTARLLGHRGPHLHRTKLARASLEHTRYLLMVQSLLDRKASLLSQPAWLTVPWEGVEKSVEQFIFDRGLILGALYEAADVARRKPDDAVEMTEIMQNCSTLDRDIESLLSAIYSTFATKCALSAAIGLSHSDSKSGDSRTSAQLLLHITALSLQLGACVTGSDTYSLLERSSEVDCIFAEISMRTLASTLGARLVPLARHIAYLSQNYLLVKTGAMGAARLVFALRLAKDQLTSEDSARAMCDDLLERFGGKAWQLGVIVRRDGDRAVERLQKRYL